MEPRPHKDTARGEAPRHFSPDAGFNMFGIVAVNGGFLKGENVAEDSPAGPRGDRHYSCPFASRMRLIFLEVGACWQAIQDVGSR